MIKIGAECWIGTNATVLEKRVVGDTVLLVLGLLLTKIVTNSVSVETLQRKSGIIYSKFRLKINF